MGKLLFTICLSAIGLIALCQDYSKLKFGDVSAKDFAIKAYSVDSNANAVVLTDIGSSKMVANNIGGFSFVFKHYRRVHILNKNGFDVATYSINLYKDGKREEKLDKLKAVTYNLSDGKVTEKKLDNKSDIFEEKVDKYRVRKKFTLPDVREGSIIEIEYTKKSDFMEYPEPWEFQGEYPRLWSEYSVAVPHFFYYVFLSQGYLRFEKEIRKDGFTSYNIRDHTDAYSTRTIQVNAGSAEFSWAVQNAPGLKEERHMYSLNNHIQRIVFQLAEQRDPLEPHQFIESWPQVAMMMLNEQDFGLGLKQEPGWLKEVLQKIPGKTEAPGVSARAIHAYLRDNYTCTGYGSVWMDKSLQETVKSKRGNIASINLLLTALLQQQGIKADPVILSTRGNGLPYLEYPMLFRFDYVVCRVQLEGKDYFLDASAPGLGFGRLPLYCYNGHARVINPAAPAVFLPADSVVEKKRMEITITEVTGGKFKGTLDQAGGYYSSYAMRKKARENGKETILKEWENSLDENTNVLKWDLRPLDSLEMPLQISATIEVAAEAGDMIYLNPWISGAYRENPFKSGGRTYPVELSHAIDELYQFSIVVPPDYMVSEIPKDLSIKLNDKGDGLFECKLTRTDEKINLVARILLRRAAFTPVEYARLRDFYSEIIKKQGEQIVFKKKK